MTVTGSARFHRRTIAPLPNSNNEKKKKRKSCYPVLLSLCLFLAILCGCLIAALVLIGKHFYQTKNVPNSVEEAVINSKKEPFLARLPNDTQPYHYNLTIIPDIEKGDFKGKVNISLVIKRPRRNILVHSKDLSIDKADLYFNNVSKPIEVQNVEEIANSELISVIPKDELRPGFYYLTLEFSGSLLNRTVGLYRSQYKNSNSSETRSIATSKFEPTYARQAFPCFDEPNMKANYTVHILKPKDDPAYIALSNMPVEKEEPQENGIMVHFKTSVQMSTYLSCFIVCDFDNLHDTFQSGGEEIPLKVYATPEQVSKTDYALKTAKGVIEYFLDYFKIEYPLPKLDLIAIPDFVSGAMEHWGLVTFRETSLLYDKDKSSTANKQRIAGVVAHELAHSWFGNLVTMDWWNDLWLNEGFASYIQYKGVHAVEPDWQMLHQFLIDNLHSVLSKDATLASHPIVQTVVTPDQITEIFDAITYNKGASLLRMLEGAIGEENFQKGVTAYLNAHKWGNAITEDFLTQLQATVGDQVNVETFMDTWTRQMGYPIVTVTEKDDSYVITQKRFLKDPDNPGNVESPYKYKWMTPITYITDQDQSKTHLIWFNHTQEKVVIPKPKGINWIKFNHNQVGYYRVNYPKEMWSTLAKNIGNMDSISDKTHLLEESFSIAESGNELIYNVPLDLTEYLLNEFNYIPWSVAASKLGQLKKYLTDSLQYYNYLTYVKRILKPAYQNLTWTEEETDDHLRRRARITVLALSCEMEDNQCKSEARKRFLEWLNEDVEISQDLRGIVFDFGMEENTEEEWNEVLERFKKEIDASEKLKLLKGLTSVKNPLILRRLIELGKNEEIIRGQDYFTMLQYIAANTVGTSIVWDYVREHWPELVDRFTLNDRYLGRLIPAITSSFITKTKLREMEVFFETYPEAGAGAAAREEALANVKNNIKWVETNKAQVEDWIEENSKRYS